MLHFKRLVTILLCAGFFALLLGFIGYVLVAATAGTFTPNDIAMGVVRFLSAAGGLFGVVLGITLCAKEGKSL